MIEPMKPSFTLIQSEIQDGDIICFQVEISETDVRQLETQGLYSNPLQFYDFLQNRVDILFKPKFYELCCTVWTKNKSQLLAQLLAFMLPSIPCYT